MEQTFDLAPKPTFSTEEVILYLANQVDTESEMHELGDLILLEKKQYCLNDLHYIKFMFSAWQTRQMIIDLSTIPASITKEYVLWPSTFRQF
ncbi:hypothetical protein [Siphonobacter sp. SORGH_AS_0500]|uniref:hypothetical protein n=1 Tax=Siphonobacter sp. SORGH_AS_0500 TaxID=1864824 RepID=UPI0028668438|nr:hypothetical protein [Siphonobacter sp. SORGH_AS_0500]MDR6195162.1 hypothetical protein [Siphonobacter sp. SORGH_AS_0500]